VELTSSTALEGAETIIPGGGIRHRVRGAYLGPIRRVRIVSATPAGGGGNKVQFTAVAVTCMRDQRTVHMRMPSSKNKGDPAGVWVGKADATAFGAQNQQPGVELRADLRKGAVDKDMLRLQARLDEVEFRFSRTRPFDLPSQVHHHGDFEAIVLIDLGLLADSRIFPPSCGVGRHL
jgi:hypothetical protein